MSDWLPVLIQIMGVVGFGLFGVSYQLLKPRNTILLQSLANIFIALHFYGLGQDFIALVALMACGRDFCSALLPRRAQVVLLVAYMVPLLVNAYIWADGWPDIMAVVGSAMATGLQFFRERFYIYRFLSLAHQGVWLAIYLAVFTVPGLVFMSCIAASNVVGIGRYVYKTRMGANH